MAESQTRRDILSVIQALPTADRVWLLAQLEQDPEFSAGDLAQIASEGGAFLDLADDPDLYSLLDGEPVEVG
jgi:hypothetical protein